MFEIIRIYTENGQEKKESMGFGTEGTLNTLADIVAKYPTKYTGSKLLLRNPKRKKQKNLKSNAC